MEDLSFEVYNQRRVSTLSYSINKTESGWHISHIAINGDCKPNGSPFFYDNFEQDYISYPSDFGHYLEWLWDQIDSNDIERDEAQIKLQELADWVSICEKSQPKWQGWND